MSAVGPYVLCMSLPNMRSMAISCPRLLRGVSDAPGNDPRPRAWHIEKRDHLFPPGLSLLTKSGQALSAIFGVTGHKLPANFPRRQGRRAHINAEHVSKPEIFTHALMHHVLVKTAPSCIGRVGPSRKVFIFEHAPHAENFDPLGFVGIEEEVVFHAALTT